MSARSSAVVTLRIPGGLHARPSVRFVQTARTFDAESWIALADDGPWFDASSILEVLRLKAAAGTRLHLRSEGAQAHAAIEGLSSLISDGFDGTDEAELITGDRVFEGRLAAPGFAGGEVYCLSRRDDEPSAFGSCTFADLESAVAALRESLQKQIVELDGVGAGLLAFYVELLDEDRLWDRVRDLAEEGLDVAEACDRVFEIEIAALRTSEDPLFSARASDFEDVHQMVLRSLHSARETPLIPPGAIVFAEDMLCSQFLATDWSQGGGIVLRKGSPRSHLALLARASGVPMLVDVEWKAPQPGAVAIVDADNGRVVLDPAEGAISRLPQRAVADMATESAAIRGGEDILGAFGLWLNIGMLRELDAPLPKSAKGFGLVRSEFLFDATDPPTGAEQFDVYRRVVTAAGGRPVVIRLFDAGSDKQLSWLPVSPEKTPALGLRGVRLLLRRGDVLRNQLRALLRAAAFGPVRILVPMVSEPGEMASVRALLESERANLVGRGEDVASVPLGMMVETPAAALAIEAFKADFLSVGTNDLNQYVTATSRESAAPDDRSDDLHPGVVRLLRIVTEYGKKSGTPVTLCGDIAAVPGAIRNLVDIGFRDFSVPAYSFRSVQEALVAEAGQPTKARAQGST